MCSRRPTSKKTDSLKLGSDEPHAFPEVGQLLPVPFSETLQARIDEIARSDVAGDLVRPLSPYGLRSPF